MTISRHSRRLLAVAATAAACSLTSIPAYAAEPVTTAPVAAAPADGPSVEIWQSLVLPGEVGSGIIATPGRPVSFKLVFSLDGKGKYTDVHFTTSNPGTARNCDMSTINAQIAKSGRMSCPVELPALATGQSKQYEVTMTGKRDGVPFSVSDTVTISAPNITSRIYLNGKDITGQRTALPAGEQFTYKQVVTNHSNAALTSVMDGRDDIPACRIEKVPAGGSAECSYTISRALLRSWMTNGAFTMGTLYVAQGDGVAGRIETVPATVVTEGQAADAPAGTPAQADPATPPLANTGLPVGATILVALGLLASGGVTVALSRRARA